MAPRIDNRGIGQDGFNERHMLPVAEASKAAAMKKLGQRIFTPVEAAAKFYPAEDYHQDYYTKSPLRYKYYRWNCGRNQRVKEIWGYDAYKGIPAKG